MDTEVRAIKVRSPDQKYFDFILLFDRCLSASLVIVRAKEFPRL